jgi:hypothetical protein
MVVVGPLVVQVEARVAVFDGSGVGFGGADDVGLGVEAALVAAVVAAVGLGRRLVGEAAGDGLPEAAIVADADEVARGGVWDPCTRTRPDPLLQAVAASIKQSPAATVPGVRIPASRTGRRSGSTAHERICQAARVNGGYRSVTSRNE